MDNRRKSLLGIFGSGKKNQRGSVLIELVVAAIIFAVVVAAVAFYFIYHVGTIDNGRAQLKLQRVGSLLMEEMAKAIREGKTVQSENGAMEVGTTYNDLMVIPHDTSTKLPRCFKFDDTNEDIIEGPDYANLNPWEILDDSHTVGSVNRTHRILCETLGFRKEEDRVFIQFTLKHDLENANTDDDLTISFGSTVKLRG